MCGHAFAVHGFNVVAVVHSTLVGNHGKDGGVVAASSGNRRTVAKVSSGCHGAAGGSHGFGFSGWCLGVRHVSCLGSFVVVVRTVSD